MDNTNQWKHNIKLKLDIYERELNEFLVNQLNFRSEFY